MQGGNSAPVRHIVSRVRWREFTHRVDAGRAEFIRSARTCFASRTIFSGAVRGAFGAVRQCVGLDSPSRQYVDCLTSPPGKRRKRRIKTAFQESLSILSLSLSLSHYPRTRIGRHARVNTSKEEKLPTLTLLQTVEPSSYNPLPWQPGPRSL